MILSQQAKKQLRGQAQTIEASIMIGEKTAFEEILRQLAINFKKHPLVKVRFRLSSRKAVVELAEKIEAGSDSVLISQVGHTASYYKELPDNKA
ncbi:MAG: YhbY family RNA-binding protein [Opitutales bacterium]|nr:YhbY family RNA-binding protein [Opitutales bacterium]